MPPLKKVGQHMQVVGSEGAHVGTVDYADGDNIRLTKGDSPDGIYHLIPQSWVDTIKSNKVILDKTVAEAKAEWFATDEDEAYEIGNPRLVGDV